MFKADNMLSAVNDYLAVHYLAITTIQTYLGNKDFPLEERWNVFLAANSVLPVETYMSDELDFLTKDPHGDLSLERHEAVAYADLDERIRDNYVEDPEDDYYDENYAAMYAKRDEWREKVLQSGHSGCVFDW